VTKLRQVWIASYPRSGNTLLRTILWHCFGCRSGSIYVNDLGGNRALEDYVGHIEYGADGRLRFPARSIPLIKTHEPAGDDSPAIYVIRDGRAVCASMWRFYGDYFSLEEIIDGKGHKFGTWADHVRSWDPWNRQNTLLLRYEDMTGDLSGVLECISGFLGRDVLKDSIPDRGTIAAAAGKFVKKKSDWRTVFSDTLMERFMAANGSMLKKAGYAE